ncbi:MAG: BamA/TamA family outer membrane protein [Saprospiraceae bacterium]|nr:BamA/TamA family outer membrane protein [Saprospiraceae bacterium]MCF8250667.1 BamA/TamA family outer membrane protein [Saprospiraceae bacterium]MCF8280805.1 BamA/TamA family outer membrane protein [Bacteroidales bacterium]MCF8312519.1 BamA/TamA family outer membrane protein [Saprospiraceae bacterium]
MLRKSLFCLAVFAVSTTLNAQPNAADTPAHALIPIAIGTPAHPLTSVTIRNIYVEGNHRTKTDIILRELDFGVNDTISLASLTERLVQNELKVLNTGLFTTAKFNFKEWVGATNEVGLLITVQEGWYVFPFPILEMADRNFNVWWDTYDHSLRRLNYGVRFYHTNLTGRRDQLKAVIQQGFTKKYELIYTLPFINENKTLGLNVNFLHTREKEIGYTTAGDELVFSRNSDHPLLRRFRLGVGAQYRRRLDITHHFNLTFHENLIDESVRTELNPDYFLGNKEQRYLAASYQMVLDKRDIRPYPMHGFRLEAGAARHGLLIHEGMDALDVQAGYQQFFSFGKKWSTGFVVKGKLGLLRNKQPYYGSQALGYEPDFIRGYEYYVVDGLDFAYNKSLLRYRLFDRKFNLGPYMKLESFREMPLKLFLVLHNELGYAHNPFYSEGNPLANDLLWGTTLGLDLVLYYDKVFNFEVSRNRLGEYGFYLHWTFSF